MAISRVQKKTATTAAIGTAITVTLDGAPIAGNLIVMGVGVLNGGQATAATSVSQTNVSWSRRLTQAWNSSDGENNTQVGRLDIWEGVVSASAGTGISITVTGSGGVARGASAFEITGQHASSPFDVSASSTDSSNPVTAVPTTGTTASTAEANEYAFGVAVTNEGSAVTYADGTPAGEATFVEQTNQGTALALLTFEGLNEAVGTKKGNASSVSHGSVYGYAGAIVTYKIAAAATAPTRTLMGVGT